MHNLHSAIVKKDTIRAAFEAAWGSHLVIDGLTPSHHQPYWEQVGLLSDKDRAKINSRLKRIFLSGESVPKILKNNWSLVGPKGIGTNHILFEAGIESLLLYTTPSRLATSLSSKDQKYLQKHSFWPYYLKSVREIASFDFFDRYQKKGWSTDLAEDVGTYLIPAAVKMTTAFWYASIEKGK